MLGAGGASGAAAAQAAASSLTDDGLQFNERKLGRDLAAQKTRDAVTDLLLNEAVSIVSDSVALKAGKALMAAPASASRPVVVAELPASSSAK
jgi:carboxyl-terminal processing protease